MYLMVDLGVSKNRGGPPKWMVKFINNGKPYFLMDDLGGFNPPFEETSIWTPQGVPHVGLPFPMAFKTTMVTQEAKLSNSKADWQIMVPWEGGEPGGHVRWGQYIHTVYIYMYI